MQTMTLAELVERENNRPGGARVWVISFLTTNGYAKFASRDDEWRYQAATEETARVRLTARSSKDRPIPVVPNLHSTMLKHINAQPERFFMGGWHVDWKPLTFDDDTTEVDWIETAEAAIEDEVDPDPHRCGAAHCRAGWCTVLGGWRGLLLEDREGPNDAGMLITIASCPDLLDAPRFHTSEEDAKSQIEDAADLGF